jgi:hypothetical protein
VIRVDKAMLQLKNADSRLKATKEDLKNQRQLLKSTQKTLSKHESFFNMMIFLAVTYVATLFKNHLPYLNTELLRQDFTIDDVEREALVSSAFDVAQDFVSSYDFASLTESDYIDSPKALQLSCFAGWMNFLYIDNNRIREVYLIADRDQ